MDGPSTPMRQGSKSDHQIWAMKADYILTILGYSVGLGSMWKFPYLCTRNGGGAFLIPYIIFSIIGGIPCVYLEMTIGQYSQSGPIKVWNMCPPFKGVGLGTVLINWFFCTYNACLFAWFFYYLYHSFSATLPWSACSNEWNTPTCISQNDFLNITANSSKSENTNEFFTDDLSIIHSSTNSSALLHGLSAAEEFWRFKVLNMSEGLENIGSLRGVLVGCLGIVYVVVLLLMYNGIKVLGKISPQQCNSVNHMDLTQNRFHAGIKIIVVYVTVSVPYILTTVFLIQGCLLPGSADGIYFYMNPKFEKLLEPKIWVEACNFALYSLGIAWGIHFTMAQHNKLNNNCFRDAVLFTVADVCTSIYGGFAFFAVMGHVAHIRGVTVEIFESSDADGFINQVTKERFNLGFIVYPEAIAALPFPQLWSALTFVTLINLGIDSLVPCFEVIVTALKEQFPTLGHRRWLLNITVLLPSFLVGLVYSSQGGMYVLTLVEWYAFFPSTLLFAMLACFVVSWIYGTKRMDSDVMMMWGKPPSPVLNLCLRFVCPCLFLALFGFSLYSYRPPKYGDYIYPNWATGIGWIISFASIIPIPVIFMGTVYKAEGNKLKENLQNALKPNKRWGPQKEYVARADISELDQLHLETLHTL